MLSAALFRGNGVTLRTTRVIQGDDNAHVGRPGEVSPAPPCPELVCELRGLCRHSYFGRGTCGRSGPVESNHVEPVTQDLGNQVMEVVGSKETFLPLNVQPVFSF